MSDSIEEKEITVWVECKTSDHQELLQMLGASDLVGNISVTPVTLNVMSVREQGIMLLGIKKKTKKQMQEDAKKKEIAAQEFFELQNCQICKVPLMFCPGHDHTANGYPYMESE